MSHLYLVFRYLVHYSLYTFNNKSIANQYLFVFKIFIIGNFREYVLELATIIRRIILLKEHYPTK